MVLASSFPGYFQNAIQQSLKAFQEPLLKQLDVEGEIKHFKKDWIETSGDYFKAVTVLPQILVGLIHFSSTGGFKEFYANTFDINIAICGVMGEGAALMYEIYRGLYYKPRMSQICNYVISTSTMYYYGVHKQLNCFIWRQNWIFLSIPVFCVVRLRLLRKDPTSRAIALILNFVLIIVISIRLYSIYRVYDLLHYHEEMPLLFALGLEAFIEIYWVYCFLLSIQKSCKDEEVLMLLFPCRRRNNIDSADLVAEEVMEPRMRMRKFTANLVGAGIPKMDSINGEAWAKAFQDSQNTQESHC